MQKSNKYDVIVLGAGAAGLAAAITAAGGGAKVLVLEKLSSVGAKLRATGGGRCNLTNTLSNDEFMERFGRNGRFMSDALGLFDSRFLREFFGSIGVQTHAPDGFRVFPVSHDSVHIVSALENEAKRLGVRLVCDARADRLTADEGRVVGVSANGAEYLADNVIIAVGGMGYPKLGAEGDGYTLAQSVGHSVVTPSPAMLPLHTKELQFAACRADTIAKAHIRIDLPKAKGLKAVGDLIFTSHGIRGPVVLDFAREITPLLEKYAEVPLLVSLTQGMNEEQIRTNLKTNTAKNPHATTTELLSSLLPASVSRVLCEMAGVDADVSLGKADGVRRDALIRLLVAVPLTVIGHDSFKSAMITRGGVSLKEIDPKTMQSKIIKGLYFCGEVMDIDGPCGGYNLQWSFASGFLAGKLG
ncbi:MAG: NAD(P)/FAD-dependent oxidoreductase [Campylobacterales bacterium]|nr:NAD(P)/FAD-dependent oxidoreductase [Campylobacterales bacterium]